jgi:hypothetical protein
MSGTSKRGQELMRRKVLHIAAVLAVSLGGLLTLTAPAAGAQTGYPPGVCNVTIGSQDAGTHAVGEAFSIVLAPVCIWDPGSVVGIVVNGQSVGTKAASANGTVTVNVVVASPTVLTINDPVNVAGHCGTNTVVGSGHSSAAGGATVTQTASFRVVCPTPPARAVQGRVAFTGANIARWGAIALALLAVGSLLVVADRRRAKARG